MAENAWGKQPPKKSAYTPPALSTPSFWGPAPVPPKVITEWEEIWGEDGGEGTAYEGQESLEVNSEGNFRAGAREQELGEAETFVGGEEKRFESEYGFEGTGADGKFQAGAREQELGEAKTFVGGEEKRFESEYGFESEGKEGTYQAGARVQELGEAKTFVGGEEKRFESEFGFESEGKEGTYQAGARESEAGAHDSWVGGEAKRFESEYGFEGTTTSGNFRAVFEGEDPNTAGSFRAVFEGLDPNTSGNFRRLMEGQQPNTAGNFQASALGASEAAETSEDQATEENFVQNYNPEGNSAQAAAFSVNPYERSGNFQAVPIAENQASSYEVVPFSGVDAPSGTFNPSPIATPSGESTPSPYIGQWNFRVEIDGIPVDNCQFVSVSNVVTETEPINYKFSSDAYMQAMPGAYKFSDVELTRVHKKDSDEFYKWREKIESGKDDMRVVTIHLLNINMNDAPVMTMVLHDAWPVKWEFPELNAGSSDAALEKITLNVGRITKG